MKKYHCTADDVNWLDETIEADSQEEAERIFQEHLDNGLVPATGNGAIENKCVEEIKI